MFLIPKNEKDYTVLFKTRNVFKIHSQDWNYRYTLVAKTVYLPIANATFWTIYTNSTSTTVTAVNKMVEVWSLRPD